MAINNPENLYTGGSVVFDSTPEVNLYAQLQAKKQAKEEALNQYFHKLADGINTAGIDRVHLGGTPGQTPGIIDEINAWKSDWFANKNEIAKGGAAAMENQKKYEGILRKVDAAKARTKQLLEIGKAKFEGKYDPDEDDLPILEKMGKSIYDPTSYKEDGVSEYSIADLSPNVPEYDPNKGFDAATKGLKAGRLYDEKNGRRDPVTGLEWINFTEKFDPSQVKNIGKNIATEFESNKSAKKYWRKQYESTTPEELAELNAVFKKHYAQAPIKLPNGKVIDMSNIDSPEEFAMAAAAKRAEEMIVEKGEVPKSDWQAKQQADINKIYIQDGLIRGRSGGSGASGTTTVEGNEFDRIELPKKNWANKGDRVSPEKTSGLCSKKGQVKKMSCLMRMTLK